LEPSDLLLGTTGGVLSDQLVDAGETFCGVVAFECHVGPCLFYGEASIGPSMATPLFRFEQSVSQLHYRAVEAVQMCPQAGHAKTWRHDGEARKK
jgi:hypothetical protein